MGPATDELQSTNKIPPLNDDGSNWISYKSRVITLITSKAGLKKHLTGRAKCPLPLATREQSDGTIAVVLDDGKTVATEDQIDERLDTIDDWEQREASVKQILFSTISDRRLLDIQNLATAALMWEKLEVLHDGKTEIVAVAKRKQLNNMSCEDNYDVRLHISNMKKLREELAGMGAPVSDVDFCGMLS